ncbi:MAG: dihydrolipoamide succinyltransferase, partial [Gemmataceae bacterium]|nr:dihydrolipoamide succinyltransferase [Gemmataceae bacterium]
MNGPSAKSAPAKAAVATAPPAPRAASAAAAAERSNDFEGAVSNALDTLNTQQLHADQLA